LDSWHPAGEVGASPRRRVGAKKFPKTNGRYLFKTITGRKNVRRGW